MGEDLPLPSTLNGWRGITRRPGWHFDLDTAEHLLSRQFGTRDLSGFGCADQPLAVATDAGITVRGKNPVINFTRMRHRPADYLTPFNIASL